MTDSLAIIDVLSVQQGDFTLEAPSVPGQMIVMSGIIEVLSERDASQRKVCLGAFLDAIRSVLINQPPHVFTALTRVSTVCFKVPMTDELDDQAGVLTALISTP
jgi:hypothetical protein